MSISSQSLSDYNWQAPKYEISPHDTVLNGLILLDYRSVYFKKIKAPYVKISKKQRLIHRQIYINEDSLIERFSRLTIPVIEEEKITNLKVRIISNNQKLLEVSRSELVKIDTLEEYKGQTVYHINGVEKGDIVEYMYSVEMNPLAYGTEIFQSIIPTRKAALQLLGNGISFKVKGYNGAKIKTLDDKIKMNIYGGVMNNLPAFQDEYYAANDANRMRVDYAASDMNWKKLSEVIALNVLYIKKKTQNKITKILENEVKLFSYTSKSDKIKAIENYIKEHYNVVHESNLSDVKKILESKQTNITGLTYLFASFLKAANIEYEVLASCDRFGRTFDRDFATPLNLDYFLFYFLDEKKFLTPYPTEFRYGKVPDFLIHQQGFSVKGSFSKTKGLASTYRFLNIDNLNGFETLVSEDINIHFNKDEEPFIALTMDISGYQAINFIEGYNEAEVEARAAYINSFIPYAVDSIKANKILLNGSNDFQDKLVEENIVIYAELPAQPFIEQKGDQSFLFKIGKLIGEQMELKDSIRYQDIELDNSITYDRKITIHYDDSFIIANADNLDRALNLPENLNEKLNFMSSLQRGERKLEVQVSEYYNFLQLNKSYYPEFRKVINAASDFSKLELLITSD